MFNKDLCRFLKAQDNGSPSVYVSAIAELSRGRKTGHWIWFVLPQLAGLGHSEMAQRYGIAGLEEARTYLADPLLRQRLETVIAVIDAQLRQGGQSLEPLMGSGLDAAKTVSSPSPAGSDRAALCANTGAAQLSDCIPQDPSRGSQEDLLGLAVPS